MSTGQIFPLEFYAHHGSLSVPDPDTFGGELKEKPGPQPTGRRVR